MFVFLPLLALSMKPLYWRPKRYYVEHLLFLVTTTLRIPGDDHHDRGQTIPVVGDQLGLLEFAVWFYMAWYLFRGMRIYYSQSRWMTFGKYVSWVSPTSRPAPWCWRAPPSSAT